MKEPHQQSSVCVRRDRRRSRRPTANLASHPSARKGSRRRLEAQEVLWPINPTVRRPLQAASPRANVAGWDARRHVDISHRQVAVEDFRAPDRSPKHLVQGPAPR
jgi:hypothetical protein